MHSALPTVQTNDGDFFDCNDGPLHVHFEDVLEAETPDPYFSSNFEVFHSAQDTADTPPSQFNSIAPKKSIGLCRRLSYREAARTHSIPETTIGTMEQFINRAITEPSRREKELTRLIGNSIPVMTLSSVVSHLLSLLNW